MTKKDVLRFADSQSDEFVTISKDAQNLFFTRWRQLNGLVYRRTSSTTQFLPSEWPLIRDRYFGKLRSFLTSVTHDPTQIFQAVIALDETHLCSEPVSPVTLDHIGAKSVRVKTSGQEKDGCSVLVAVMYDCKKRTTVKMPLYFLWKCATSGEKLGPELKAIAKKLFCEVDLTEKGWMKAYNFDKYVVEMIRGLRNVNGGLTGRILLSCDVHASHLDVEFRQHMVDMNVQLSYVDPGMTGKLQVPDLVINKPMQLATELLYRQNRVSVSKVGEKTPRVTREDVMTWAVTAFSDATVSLDVISRCIEKNILVSPISSKGEELHSTADLARYDVAWRKHNNLAEQSYCHLNPLDAVLPASKRPKPKKGEARPQAAPTGPNLPVPPTGPNLPVPPTGPTLPVPPVARQEAGKERFQTERFLGLMCRAVNGGNVAEGAALQVKLAKHGFNTATKLANWWTPGESDLNQCEKKMVEKIIVDWKANLSWIDVDAEDVAAGSAMHYALKNINK